jgi:hypothetical protein
MESTHQGRLYEVLHDMVPSISKSNLGVSTFRPAVRTMKVKADRSSKLNQLVSQTICYFHTKFGVDLVTATQKIRVLLTPCFDHKMTLTFDINDLIAIDGQLYKRCYIYARLDEREKCVTEMITYKTKTK